MGSSLTIKVAPRRLLKSPDQAAGQLSWLPTSHKQGMPAGHKHLCLLVYFQQHVVGTKWVTGRGAGGRQCMGLANGHYKQLGLGLLVLGEGSLQHLSGYNQAQPVSRVTPNAIQGLGYSKISGLLAEGVPHWRLWSPLFVHKAPFRHTAWFWLREMFWW